MAGENNFDEKGKERGKSREELIRHSWSSLEKNQSLSLKEKLEKLLALARECKVKKSPLHPEDELSSPERETGMTRISGFRIFENTYPLDYKYGRVSLGQGLKIEGRILALLAHNEAFKELSLSSALFLDLETTGLSGGVGVIPFLIGFGYFGQESLEIRQFFLGEPAEEEAMIQEVYRFLESNPFECIVSFNGRGFDLPILETRFTLHRLPFPLADLPHLDFIFAARQLWKHKHESCRLSHLAEQVLKASRWEDIPSSEVPVRYFSYLRSGQFSFVEPVLEHNVQDILSLLGIVIAASELLKSSSFTEDMDSSDLIGLARILEAAGEAERSFELLEMALRQGVPESLAFSLKKKLAWYWKKNRQWARAVALWEEMAPAGKLFCYRELAMYYEHCCHDYERARELAAEGLSLARGVSRTYEEDFLRRLQRLEAKIQKGRLIG
jgi:uncharacterized protein YprB with RNaseH-like and TPR domain